MMNLYKWLRYVFTGKEDVIVLGTIKRSFKVEADG